MNREVASEIQTLILRFIKDMDQSVQLVMDKCDDQEILDYRHAVGRTLDGLMEEFLKPIYREHPDLIPADLRDSIRL